MGTISIAITLKAKQLGLVKNLWDEEYAEFKEDPWSQVPDRTEYIRWQGVEEVEIDGEDYDPTDIGIIDPVAEVAAGNNDYSQLAKEINDLYIYKTLHDLYPETKTIIQTALMTGAEYTYEIPLKEGEEFDITKLKFVKDSVRFKLSDSFDAFDEIFDKDRIATRLAYDGKLYWFDNMECWDTESLKEYCLETDSTGKIISCKEEA